jgi:hypothetical protein
MIDADSRESGQDAGVVRVAVTIPVGADETWRQIGGFAVAGRFTGMPSRVVYGNGGVASIREVGDAVTEKMVAEGDRFYVYVQTCGPMADYGYHGCLAVEGDATQCTINYTLVYDAAALSPVQRESEHASLVQRFRHAVEAMADHVGSALRPPVQ